MKRCYGLALPSTNRKFLITLNASEKLPITDCMIVSGNTLCIYQRLLFWVLIRLIILKCFKIADGEIFAIV